MNRRIRQKTDGKRRAGSRARRGIALIAVLTVSVVLLALAGAFFAAHKTDLMLMGTSAKLERTKTAALSAAQFIQYKLENDRTYAATSFESLAENVEYYPTTGDPLLEIEYIGADNDVTKNVIKGRMPATDLTFEARVYNNLNIDSAGYHPLGEVPPRAARVWITAKQGSVTKKMDMILKRSPFTSVSMVAGGDVDVELSSSDGKWWLGSRQPGGAGVRAKGTVTTQEVLSERGSVVSFEPPDGLAAKINPPYGAIQGSRIDVVMNGQLVRNVRADDPRLAQVQDSIDGSLLPTRPAFEVPPLASDKLAAPAIVYPAPADKIVFKTEKVGDRVQYSLWEGDNDSPTQIYDGTNNATRKYSWPPGSSAPLVVFDLEAGTMSVAPDVELESSGNFSLSSIGVDGAVSNQPALILGSETEPASIKASSINIAGSVAGLGALKAGAGGLKVRALSSLSTTPDFGVALHSEGDVVLSKPSASKADGLPADWDAYAKAFNSGSQPRELRRWMEQSDASKENQARRFSELALARPGETTSTDDPLWLALTREFPADSAAKNAFDSWMQPAVYGPDPEAETGAGTGATGATSTSTGAGMTTGPVASGGDTADGTGGISSNGTGLGTTGAVLGIEVIDLPTGSDVGGTSGGDAADITDGTDGMGGTPGGLDIESSTGGTTATTGSTGAVTGGVPAPDVLLVPAGPGLNMERYIRLREYLKTVKAGTPDESWLRLSSDDIGAQRQDDVRGLIKNQLSSYQLAAGQTAREIDGHVVLEWNGLDTYFKPGRSNPFLSGYNPDMHFRGLVYALGDFIFDTQQKGIKVEGAVVSGGNTRITQATGARIIYNSELLENLFATNQGDLSVRLERSFWAYY